MLMEITIDRFKKPDYFSDCRLFCFRMLFSYYGYYPSETELFGYGEGIDLKLKNVSPLSTKVFLPVGRTDEFEINYAKKVGIPIKVGTFDEHCEFDELISTFKMLIEKGKPVVVNVDRFYLDFLSIKKAHMGLHAVLVIGYDESSFIVLDGLNQNKINKIGYEDFYNAVMSKCPIPTGKKYYYIEQEDYYILKEVNKYDFLRSIKNASSFILDECIGPIKEYLSYLKLNMFKNKEMIIKFMDIQRSLLIDSIREQERSHYFYRLLFFSHIKNNKSFISKEYHKKMFGLFDKLKIALETLVNVDGCEETNWIYIFEEYINAEKKVHEYLLELVENEGENV